MNIALILSGGTGKRLDSNIPKQYVKVGGKPVISYCMECLFHHPMIHGVQIVADPLWQEQIKEWMGVIDRKKIFRGFSLPGENRQISILHGMEDIRRYAGDSDYVLIHDAARPVVSEGQITSCLEAASGHDGAVPVLPMKDTVYCSRDQKRLTGLLVREEIYAGQAPEAFCLGRYYEANRKLLPDRILHINGSAEPGVLYGMDLVMIPGDEGNFKITTKEDLDRFRRLKESR